MQGWIKIHRQLLESLIFGNEKALKIWVWCLLKASHNGNEFLLGRTIIKLKKGEFVMGLNKASAELCLAKSTIKYWLDFLEKQGQVALQKTNRFTIVKVIKWSQYQGVELKRTTKENLKETIKNVKNEKNEKKLLATSDEVAGINEIFDLFYQSINPGINFGNKTNRKAVKWLINKWGLAEVVRITKQVISAQSSGDKFCPTATTPFIMKEKLGDFAIYFKKNKKSKRNII